MSDFRYEARARITKVEGIHRRAFLEDGTAMEMGVHGPVKVHYGLQGEKNLPLPVDYMVAATGG